MCTIYNFFAPIKLNFMKKKQLINLDNWRLSFIFWFLHLTKFSSGKQWTSILLRWNMLPKFCILLDLFFWILWRCKKILIHNQFIFWHPKSCHFSRQCTPFGRWLENHCQGTERHDDHWIECWQTSHRW